MLQAPLSGQEEQDYMRLYREGQYREALEQLQSRLAEEYSTRVEDKRVPSGFITMKNVEKDVDLKQLFRERKAKSLFIEENDEMANLHEITGRCHYELNDYDRALSHYFQSLRFTDRIEQEDHDLYYAIALAFQKKNLIQGYRSFLEGAAQLNPENADYARELGISYSRSRHPERAVYYLERYFKLIDKPDPELFLLAASLYESLSRYLPAEDMYLRYLEVRNSDGAMHFALGHLARTRTGHQELAERSLTRALELLPETDLYRRSKSYEYLGDMAFRDLEYRESIQHYRETLKVQENVQDRLDGFLQKKEDIENEINRLKSRLLTDPRFDEYEEYEYQLQERGRIEEDIRSARKDLEKLNPGGIRWKLAKAHKRLEEYQEAIGFYRQSIEYDHKPVRAREEIVKLQLKIERGY
jgi:tetratricopeptide (TPR) repeat protein